MGNAVKFRETKVPRQPGEQARLKVVQGPDLGSTFVFTGSRVTIGRGDDNDVILSDLKASRKHLEIFLKQSSGEWLARDLGSANGFFYNGQPFRESILKSGSSITLGETTVEFVPAAVGTTFLAAPPKSMAQIKSDQQAFAVEQKKAKTQGPTKKGSHSQGSLLKGPRVLMIAAGLLGVFFLFSLEQQQAQNQSKKGKAKGGRELDRGIAAYLPPAEVNSATSRTVEMFLKAGFREYREKNYLRAKTQFETALQIAPGHPLASLYLQNCEKGITDEVTSHLERGKKSFESGKLRQAQSHYQAILRLLYRDQSKHEFKEAQEQLQQVEKAMKGGAT